MSRIRRLWDAPPAWIARAMDAVLAIVIVAIGLTEVLGSDEFRPLGVFLASIALAGAGTLVRRRYPWLTLGTAYTAYALTEIGSDWTTAPSFCFLAVLVAMYAVGRYSPSRYSFLAPITGVSLLVLELTSGAVFTDLLFVGVFLTGVWGAGFLLRRSRHQEVEMEVQAAELFTEGEERARAAVTEERGRIARELHDIIAHQVSVIAVQTGAAEQTLEQGRSDEVRESLTAIRGAARQALEEMRRLLGVLRQSDDGLALMPQPGLDQVEGLIANARSSGIGAELTVEGTPYPLPTGLDLTAYRIVQESLTNVLKHAGKGASARVSVNYGTRLLEISVGDDGAGPPRELDSINNGGHGLVGIRERVALYGGDVRVGRSDAGGFELRVRLPVEDQPR